MNSIDKFIIGAGSSAMLSKMSWVDQIGRKLGSIGTPNYLHTKSMFDNFSWIERTNMLFAKMDFTKQMIIGSNTLSTLMYRDIKTQTSLNALIGIGSVVNRTPSKYLIDNFGICFQNDLRKQATLTAVMGMSTIISKFPSKYLIDNIVQSERMGKFLSTQNAFAQSILGVSKLAMNSSSIRQLQSLGFVYNSISTKIGLGAVAIDEENEIDLVEEVTSRVANAASELYERGYVTKEDLINFKKEIFDFFHSQAKGQLKWTVFSIILSIILTFVPSLIENIGVEKHEDAATKEDIERLKEEIFPLVNSAHLPNILTKRLSANVNLRAKASQNSFILMLIVKGSLVRILDVKDDWAYVYVDNINGLPACCWISTKFFCKETFSKTFQERRSKNRLPAL